jgi:GTPase
MPGDIRVGVMVLSPVHTDGLRPVISMSTFSHAKLVIGRTGSGPPEASGYAVPVMSPKASYDLAAPVEKAFLLAVDTGDDPGWTAEDSLNELAALAVTAGAEVVGAEWQNRRHIDPNWYVGKGKAEELAQAKSETGFEILIADDELSPTQQKSLESLLNVKVIDRSRLILDIFALHARTHEGRLQVELAQLEYQLPRLTRLWTHLSRTGGGIGTRGPGESQLETDRRLIRERIKKMKEKVEDVRRQRETTARGRDRRLYSTVAIVGYTNAGKSTLLNSLVGSEVALAEDKLFATLDPTSRQVKLGEGQTAIITDTVGFIHKLPHQLVDAFRATLEEVNRADALLEVVDASDSHFEEHRATVQLVLDELGAGDKPRLVAFNKADLLGAAGDGETHAPVVAGAVLVSALTGFGLDTLRLEVGALLASLWEDVDVAVPYAAGELLARVRERGNVDLEYGNRDVRVRGRMAPSLAGELRAVADRWAETLADEGITA